MHLAQCTCPWTKFLDMQAAESYNAGMQYTLRNVPRNVDQALRAKARAERKSLNEAAVEVLKTGLGVSDEPAKKRDLSDLVGSLSESDAKAINDAVACLDKADLKLRRGGRA